VQIALSSRRETTFAPRCGTSSNTMRRSGNGTS
jgi:hypothetical protein